MLLLILVYTVVKSTVFGCNPICECWGTEIVCNNRNLSIVPSGIPNTAISWALNGNQLTTLQENGFQNYTVLERLSLNSNQITMLTTNLFQGLVALQSLILSANQITMLSANVFQGLIALRFLYLDRNQISTIEANAFQGLTVLESLMLNENNLTEIDGQMFEGLASIQNMYLQRNNITAVDGHTFEELTSLTLLRLDINPMDCSNCELESFKDFLLNNTNVGDASAKCDDILVIDHNFNDCKEMTTKESQTTAVEGTILIGKGTEVTTEAVHITTANRSDSMSTTHLPSVLLLIVSLCLSLSSICQLSKSG